jgi:hypothetical protein
MRGEEGDQLCASPISIGRFRVMRVFLSKRTEADFQAWRDPRRKRELA